MNKQELINELKKISLEKQHKALTHPESKNYYEGMVMAYSQVVHMVNTVLKLDEPQKPVVPQSIAVLIEKYKEDDVQLTDILVCFKDWLESEEGDYRDEISWVVANPETFMRAWLDGYEVEKDPLYCVIINGRYLVKVFSNTNVVILVPADEISQYVTQKFQLTEKQIKAIDERYWPFAVPVEEAEA
ncbi:phage protein, putative [Enterococcus faecium]|uniref:DUF1642 domain-containing protein n=1 Tax=Enterococcus faecium TaxID=1352 RepID=UPI000DFBE3E1|nr:DUF1642 domain-containing protein [Enterococcus faecium]STD67473.1 phage protein, putative [Enterococcus faecium]HAQ5689041.1 DUF1642 domain-containing protein [Enterococcus faecium]